MHQRYREPSRTAASQARTSRTSEASLWPASQPGSRLPPSAPGRGAMEGVAHFRNHENSGTSGPRETPGGTSPSSRPRSEAGARDLVAAEATESGSAALDLPPLWRVDDRVVHGQRLLDRPGKCSTHRRGGPLPRSIVVGGGRTLTSTELFKRRAQYPAGESLKRRLVGLGLLRGDEYPVK